jgi:hypothetical protein
MDGNAWDRGSEGFCVFLGAQCRKWGEGRREQRLPAARVARSVQKYGAFLSRYLRGKSFKNGPKSQVFGIFLTPLRTFAPNCKNLEPFLIYNASLSQGANAYGQFIGCPKLTLLVEQF